MPKNGLLQLDPDHCVNMPGAIHLFYGIDPRVRRIETQAGDRLDIVYVRTTGYSGMPGWNGRVGEEAEFPLKPPKRRPAA